MKKENVFQSIIILPSSPNASMPYSYIFQYILSHVMQYQSISGHRKKLKALIRTDVNTYNLT